MMTDRWWHIETWPSPTEWQAVFALIALIIGGASVIYALGQLRLTRQQVELGAAQVREAASAGRRAADAEEARTRPYVNVRLRLQARPAGDPTDASSGEGVIYLVVQNVGATPARDIRLSVTPKFQTSGYGKPVGTDLALAALHKVFSGSFPIAMLSQGQHLDYFLDFTAKVMNTSSGLPQRYSVTTRYQGADRRTEYEDEFVIDFEAWSMTIMEALPADVIARQLRRLNQNIEAKW